MKKFKMTTRTPRAPHPLGLHVLNRWWNGNRIELDGPATIVAERRMNGTREVVEVFIECPKGTMVRVANDEQEVGPMTIGDLRKAIAGLPADMPLDAASADVVFSISRSETAERAVAAAPPATGTPPQPVPGEVIERPKAIVGRDLGDEN
jgi:hypothetical protein